MVGVIRFAFLLVLLWAGAGSAMAERRVALVIGNGSGYRYVGAQLANPETDARAMADRLKALGFDVFAGESGEPSGAQLNLTREEFAGTLIDFAAYARGADAVVFFYAGHGAKLNNVDSNDENYLIPVDATLLSEADLRLEAIPLSAVLAATSSVRGAQILILDACRNNPYALRGAGSVSRGPDDQGLSKQSGGFGTLLAYSTSENRVAADAAPGSGGHSPYAKALLDNLGRDDSGVRDTFASVGEDVVHATNGEQIPEVADKLGRTAFRFGRIGETMPETAPPPAYEMEDVSLYGFVAPVPHGWERGLFPDLTLLRFNNIDESTTCYAQPHDAVFTQQLLGVTGTTPDELQRAGSSIIVRLFQMGNYSAGPASYEARSVPGGTVLDYVAGAYGGATPDGRYKIIGRMFFPFDQGVLTLHCRMNEAKASSLLGIAAAIRDGFRLAD